MSGTMLEVPVMVPVKTKTNKDLRMVPGAESVTWKGVQCSFSLDGRTVTVGSKQFSVEESTVDVSLGTKDVTLSVSCIGGDVILTIE